MNSLGTPILALTVLYLFGTKINKRKKHKPKSDREILAETIEANKTNTYRTDFNLRARVPDDIYLSTSEKIVEVDSSRIFLGNVHEQNKKYIKL